MVRAAELQRDDGGREQSRAAQVHPFTFARGFDVQVAEEREAGEAERHVDPEDRRPSEAVGQRAAQRWTEEGPEHRRESDQRHGGAAAFTGVEGHQDPLGERQQSARGEALYDAEGDQRRGAARGCASHRRQGERGHLADEVSAHSDAGGDARGKGHRDEAGQRIPRHHPADRSERAAQVALDLWNGDVDDAAVDGLEHRPEQDASDGEPDLQFTAAFHRSRRGYWDALAEARNHAELPRAGATRGRCPSPDRLDRSRLFVVKISGIGRWHRLAPCSVHSASPRGGPPCVSRSSPTI